MSRVGILLPAGLIITMIGRGVMTFMISVIHTLWQDGSGFRMQSGKAAIPAALLHIVWVVTFGTDKPAFFTV